MLIELVRRGAERRPQQPLVLSRHGAVSYADCVARSEGLARGLSARSMGRFGCVVGDPAELVALLCAAAATGSEACVYPAGLDDDEVMELAAALDHDMVVSDLDELAGAGGGLPPEVPPPAERSPVLILTTGTTGRPKGARHDWTRLVGAVRHPDPQPGARWLLAYNLNQFAGLQVLLHVLVSGATLVVPESNRPRDAVTAMRDLGVTHASATPTFWRVALGALNASAAGDIPLRQITLGGEAVPASLPEELGRLFPDARVSQIYASTELGSCVAVHDGRGGLPRSLLDRADDAPVQFRIVDGELQGRSEVGMLGYRGEGDVDDGWRPTGDLVEVRGDRIQFVGRTSDVINVGGVKVHPLPVEEVVSGVEGVELAHAYGRANPVTGEIVAVDVVARPDADTEPLEDAIRAACESLPAAARPRRIRFVADIVRQHKIDRRASA